MPEAVAPEELPTHAEQVHRKQQAAGCEQCVVDEQWLAQAQPLAHAVHKQAQGQPGQYALQHLLVDRLAEHGRWLVERDWQDHRPPCLDAHQQFVLQPGPQIQRERVGSALQRTVRVRVQAAQGCLLDHIAAGREVDADVVQVGVVDIQDPLGVRRRGHFERDAQPDCIGPHPQRGAHAGGRGELIGLRQYIFH